MRLEVKATIALIIFCAIVPMGSANDESCTPIKTAPSASSLKCSPTVCNATCIAKYKFPKGESFLSTECINKKWTIKNPKYKDLKELPGCQPVCSPACANKGKCVAPNRCQCFGDFMGATCRDKKCKTQPQMTRNAKRSCSQSQCKVTCMSGFKFKNSATAMNLQCRNGKWVVTSKNLALNLHCEPHCSSKCLNGGSCVGNNKCKCPQNFKGPQCQHSTEKCSPKTIGFNGSYNCSGSETEMSCSLACPDGVSFESPPAKIYKCKFSDGVFSPLPVPKCVYDEEDEIVQQTPVHGQPEKLTSIGRNQPVCNPQCMNGGSCIYTDTCQCPENFAGKQCQHSVERCSPSRLGFNGGIRCSGTMTEMSCTISCPPGIEFDSPPAAAYTCKFESGVFSPTKIPRCVYGEGVQVIQRNSLGFGEREPNEATCNPACSNGGTCIFHNMCQCPKNFRGAHCQYSVDRCSIKNTDFNGGFRCSGSATEMSCVLSCPAGVEYEFTPAPAYVCKYETGQFTPSPIPKCVFGEGVEVIRRVTSN